MRLACQLGGLRPAGCAHHKQVGTSTPRGPRKGGAEVLMYERTAPQNRRAQEQPASASRSAVEGAVTSRGPRMEPEVSTHSRMGPRSAVGRISRRSTLICGRV